MRVRPYAQHDLDPVASVHAEAFVRQGHSKEWIAALARAHPRTRLYVAVIDGGVRGYIAWTEKGGFRAEAVMELEQIAVAEPYRKRGIGEALILRSLPDVVDELAKRAATLQAVIVSTRTDNAAQRLYRKTLGAEIEATTRALYSGDEVLMVARKPL